MSELPGRVLDSPDEQQIVDEFKSTLNDLAGYHGMAVMGISRMEALVPDLRPPGGAGPASTVSIGFGNPNLDGQTWQRWLHSELPGKLAPDGEILHALGQQWLVMVVTRWENYRARMAKLLDVPAREIVDEGMADVTWIRNDVVHGAGIAGKGCKKCKVVRWFAPGESIDITAWHVHDFMSYMGLTHDARSIGGDDEWTAIGGW